MLAPMLDRLINFVDQLGHWGFLVVFLVVLLECQALIGLLVPGESLVLATGFMAAQDLFELDDLIFVVALGAIVGDTISFELGRRLGREWLLRAGRGLGVTAERLDRVEAFFPRHGGKAVFMSHFLHMGRALMPFLAGASRMHYRRFVIYNAAGCIIWAALFVLLGYAAGESWRVVEKWIGRAGLFMGLLPVLILGSVLIIRQIWFGPKWGKFDGEKPGTQKNEGDQGSSPK